MSALDLDAITEDGGEPEDTHLRPLFDELNRMYEMEIARLRAALANLVAALPKCDECARHATRSLSRGVWLCDAHGDGGPMCRHAAPMRAAIALLEATGEKL